MSTNHVVFALFFVCRFSPMAYGQGIVVTGNPHDLRANNATAPTISTSHTIQRRSITGTGSFTAIGENRSNLFQPDNTVYVDGTKYPITSAGLVSALTAAAALGISATVVLDQQITVPSPITIPANVSLLCRGSGGVQQANNANLRSVLTLQNASVKANANSFVRGCRLDGNLANNKGSYPNGGDCILIGNGTPGTGVFVGISIDHNDFVNCSRNCVGVYGVAGVKIDDNVATNVGGQFAHIYGGDIAPGDSQIEVEDNTIDFSNRVTVLSGTFTNGQAAFTTSGANTNWGKSGYDSAINIAVPNFSALLTISSCPSSTRCTLTANFGGMTGTYNYAVGGEFAIGVIGASGVKVERDHINGVDGSLEAINFTSAPSLPVNDESVSDNTIIWPWRTVGAEAIAFGNAIGKGGSGSAGRVSGNTIKCPYSTGITIAPPVDSAGNVFYGFSITKNTIIDANCGNVPPPPGFDNAIRVTGAQTDLAIIDGNMGMSTRTGLSPARNSWNYLIAVDNAGHQATNTIIGQNRFNVADTRGTYRLVRDNGKNTHRLNPRH